MIYIMKKEEGGTDVPVVTNKQMLVYSGTWDAAAFFELEGAGKNMAMPGEDVRATLRLVKPQVLSEGQQLTIRSEGNTVGSGKVLHQIHFTQFSRHFSCTKSHLSSRASLADQLEA